MLASAQAPTATSPSSLSGALLRRPELQLPLGTTRAGLQRPQKQPRPRLRLLAPRLPLLQSRRRRL
eukprot:1030852-Alexandrium_andersonii.AAC.1